MEISINATSYALEQLAIRAGIEIYSINNTTLRLLDLPFYYGMVPEQAAHLPAIFVKRCSHNAWTDLLESPVEQLTWLSSDNTMPAGQSLPVSNSIPALFWGEDSYEDTPRFVECHPDGSITFHVDIIATTLFMLTRWEETVNQERDHHNRFPATASVSYKMGILQRPLVDEYALVLKAWIQHIRCEWQPRLPKFQIKLTHDIDYTQRCNNAIQLAKAVGVDLLRQKSLSQSFSTVAGYLSPANDMYMKGIYQLAAFSKSAGLSSSFYFMAASITKYDSGYDCASPLLKKCYADLLEMGFTIGFHPSYYTLDNPELLAAEKSKLTAAAGHEMVEGRHHYLRFRTPDTWRNWEQVGLKHDLSLGYADAIGFRCGTCHTFQVFDIKNDRTLDLYETPLIVMDATLKLYNDLTPEAGRERILELAKICQAVNGTFSLLWHNYALSGYWKNWAVTYQKTLTALARMT